MGKAVVDASLGCEATVLARQEESRKEQVHAIDDLGDEHATADEADQWFYDVLKPPVAVRQEVGASLRVFFVSVCVVCDILVCCDSSLWFLFLV